ncbi:MAG: RraA family protein, partial [Cyclobacteriaceae bacterium]|nr:RraA family protein [Cyclobacteriaceae bacterium]
MNLRERIIVILLFVSLSQGYSQTLSKEQMIMFTSEWTGERFPDGRPKVSDDLIRRVKNISIEEAWGVLRGAGYFNQFEGNWQMIRSDVPIAGRVITAQYMPNRPDISEKIKEIGKKEGRVGNTNSWPIDMLVKGDVYVADAFN